MHLVYSKCDCIDCTPLVLWSLSINLDVDVIRFQLFNSAHSIRVLVPNSLIECAELNN